MKGEWCERKTNTLNPLCQHKPLSKRPGEEGGSKHHLQRGTSMRPHRKRPGDAEKRPDMMRPEVGGAGAGAGAAGANNGSSDIGEAAEEVGSGSDSISKKEKKEKKEKKKKKTRGTCAGLLLQ